MWPIFNEKVDKKWYLWVREQCTNALFTVEKVSLYGWKQKKKKKGCVRDRAPGPFYEMLGQTHVNGWSRIVASQNGGSTSYIFPFRLRVLQWSCHLFNYWKNKKTIIEKEFLILLIWNWIYIDHRKLHGFSPRYNLR